MKTGKGYFVGEHQMNYLEKMVELYEKEVQKDIEKYALYSSHDNFDLIKSQVAFSNEMNDKAHLDSYKHAIDIIKHYE